MISTLLSHIGTSTSGPLDRYMLSRLSIRTLNTAVKTNMARTTDQIVKILLERPLPPLEPGTKVYDPSLTKEIKQSGEPKFVIAALHLANDDIENCHLIAQDHEGDDTANMLHATLHRREGDYWNSKYWWSRTTHPLFPSSRAKSFVDECEIYAGKGNIQEQSLRERQWEELKRIVDWTRANCK